MDAVLLGQHVLVHFMGKDGVAHFEDKLAMNESRLKNSEGYIRTSIIEGLFLLIGGMCAGALVFTTKPEGFIGLGIIGGIAPFFINYIFQDIVFEKRKRAKEALLPDLLLEASVFCDETSLLTTITRLSEQSFGALSTDFARAKTEIQKGASIEAALGRIKKRNKSKTYNRVIDLLLQGYNSGTHMSDALKETAEDILENQAILKERAAVMLVTKYTLLISAALIVPAILGTIIGLISGFSIGNLDAIGFGLNATERSALFTAATLGATLYIGEYVLLASYFLALQEGNKKNFFVYASVMLPLAAIIFFTAQHF